MWSPSTARRRCKPYRERYRLRRFGRGHEPIQVGELRGREADPAAVLGLADKVRDVIQRGLHTGLERRGSVFSSLREAAWAAAARRGSLG